MALKSFRPYTASRRFATMIDKSEITKQTPEKSLVSPQKRTGGRSNRGDITIWHRGGGHKRQYRSVDFLREKKGIPAKVAAIEYDPNRSARLALLHYVDGEKRYILHPVGLEVGMTVQHRRGRRHSARQRDADPVYSARHAGAQPGARPRQGRTGGSLGGRLGAIAVEGRRNRAGEIAFG